MPKPTSEQLEKINKFTLTPLTEENCFVFPDLMIDDQATAYSSKIHENLLRKFVKDANRGVGLLMNHNNRSLPVGRSFEAGIREDFDTESGRLIKSVYGNFYIDLGRKTESGMSTDDLAKGIESGTIFDTSIGFNASSWDCSICNHDIRDWMNCDHFPGEKYQVKNENGVNEEVTCYVIAGTDGEGELLENSLVYAGACDRATIKQNFSLGESVKESEKGSNLQMIDNFKNIPMNATIFQYFTKDGSVLFTDTKDRTDGLEQLKRRSEENVEFTKFKSVVENFGIKFETEEELNTELSKIVESANELAKKDEAITELNSKVEELSNKATELEGQLSTKDEVIVELTAKNEELVEKAELGVTYRQDLMNKAIETGVRAQGNAFNADMYGKFLSTLSVEEIKTVIEGFEKEVDTRFAGTRTTEPKPMDTNLNVEPQSAEDFDSEAEFRNKVAEEAMQYAKENNVSFKEATKLVREKYINGSDK